VAWVSTFVTLYPGDLIFTGTPPGVGCFRKPPLWLKEGDVVTCHIEGIGAITNKVVPDDVDPRPRVGLLGKL
jgi:2-keto-4-pentenoate hydratase/2-oxohepta-3-ene-1,7-dioic acid hydratase in catechol pathway